MDRRFQHLMGRLAHAAGHWTHFVLWCALFLAWLAGGPFAHWSDSYQLVWNGLTTTVELFLGLALLVDGAAQINLLLTHNARMEELLTRTQIMLGYLQLAAAREAGDLARIETTLDRLHTDLQDEVGEEPAP